MEPLPPNFSTTVTSETAPFILKPDKAHDCANQPSVKAAFVRLMEWGMLRYSDEVGFESNTSGHGDASKMSFLSIDDLSGFCWPMSTDLMPAFQAAIIEVGNEAQRIKFLSEHLIALVKIPNMIEQLSRMIVAELEQGEIPGPLLKNAGLNDKVRFLVKLRLQKDVARTPNDYKQHPEKPEFQVHLMTLREGEGGLMDNTKLYISYDTCFEEFLGILRDATQLSTIRFNAISVKPKGHSSLSIVQQLLPIDQTPDELRSPKMPLGRKLREGQLNPLKYEKESVRLDLGQLPVIVTEPMPLSNAKSNTSANAIIPSTQSFRYELEIPRNEESYRSPPYVLANRSSEARTGYTLLHGPWSYYIDLGEGKKGPWNDIYNKEDFSKMQAALKLRSEKAKLSSRVFFQHSQDKKTREEQTKEWEAARKAAIEQKERWVECFINDGCEFKGELVASEPYGEYIRNKAEAAYNKGSHGLELMTDIFGQ